MIKQSALIISLIGEVEEKKTLVVLIEAGQVALGIAGIEFCCI